MEFWNKLYGLARPFRGSLLLCLVITIAAQVIGFLPMLAQKSLFDSAEKWIRGSIVLPGDFALVLAGLVVAGILSEFGTQVVGYLTEQLQMRMGHQLNTVTSEHLLRLSLGFHTRRDTAEKLKVVESGIRASHEIIWAVLVHMIPISCMSLVFIFWTLSIAWIPSVIMVVGCVLMFVCAKPLFEKLRPIRRRWRDADNASDVYRHDVIRNIRMVKATAAEQTVLGGIVKRSGSILDLYQIVAKKLLRLNSIQVVFRQGTSGAVLTISLWQLLEGNLSLGTLTLLYGVSQRLAIATQNFLQFYSSIERHRSHSEKLFELLEIKPDVLVPTHPIPLGTMDGSIAFENVSFSYPDTTGTIRDASLYIPAGRTVAIVGSSGAGKSTIATLMLRGFDPHAGRILVDGKDLREIDLMEYLHQVGIVTQGNPVFSLTVRENITFGVDGVTQERLEEVTRMAGAHTFITALKDGYDTPVGENGVMLSGGQNQRIAIARALLRDPRVLILDEATSHLDVETEALIMEEVVRRIKGTRTVIIIAHRLSTIRCADEVVVVDQGRVVQQGSYKSLRSAPGVFRRLIELQVENTLL